MEELNFKDKLSGRNEAAAIITAAIISKCNSNDVGELQSLVQNIYRKALSDVNLVISPPK